MDVYQGGMQSPPQETETSIECIEVGRSLGIRAIRLNRSCHFSVAIRIVLGISLEALDSEVATHLISEGHTKANEQIQRLRQTTADGRTPFLRTHGSVNYFPIESGDPENPVYIRAMRFGRFINEHETDVHYSLDELFLCHKTDLIILNDIPGN
jgi:hypothetical protein